MISNLPMTTEIDPDVPIANQIFPMSKDCYQIGCQLGTLRTCCTGGCERLRRLKASEAIVERHAPDVHYGRGIPCPDE